MNLREAVEKARQSWRSKHGLCTMCGVGDRPSGGLHRGQYRCGNATSCGLCRLASSASAVTGSGWKRACLKEWAPPTLVPRRAAEAHSMPSVRKQPHAGQQLGGAQQAQ
jgi:hypothetical protein